MVTIMQHTPRSHRYELNPVTNPHRKAIRELATMQPHASTSVPFTSQKMETDSMAPRNVTILPHHYTPSLDHDLKGMLRAPNSIVSDFMLAVMSVSKIHLSGSHILSSARPKKISCMRFRVEAPSTCRNFCSLPHLVDLAHVRSIS